MYAYVTRHTSHVIRHTLVLFTDNWAAFIGRSNSVRRSGVVVRTSDSYSRGTGSIHLAAVSKLK